MWPFGRNKAEQALLTGRDLSLAIPQLTDKERRANAQAAGIARSVLRDTIMASTRCEHIQYKKHSVLPRSFIFAMTRSHVHVLREIYEGDELVGAEVVRTWNRAGFTSTRSNDDINRAARVPADQQILYLGIPPDGFADDFDRTMAASFAAQGRSGTPTEFVVARDAATDDVIEALGSKFPIVIGGQPQAPSAPQKPVGERLMELESLRAAGAITDAEYARQREQIIADI